MILIYKLLSTKERYQGYNDMAYAGSSYPMPYIKVVRNSEDLAKLHQKGKKV